MSLFTFDITKWRGLKTLIGDAQKLPPKGRAPYSARHFLKIAPVYFEQVASGQKPYEIRDCTDRTFLAGDVVILQEWDRQYTGRELSAIIGYVTCFKQQSGYEVFGLLDVKNHGQ